MNSDIDEEILMDLALIEEAASSRRKKVYKKHINAFEKYDDREFFVHYRFNKETLRYIVETVREELAPRTNRGGAISVETIVLVAIRYLGKGSYQSDVGDLHNISQQSVSNCVTKFVRALANKMSEFINFPLDSDSLVRTKSEFYRVAGFPQCIGAVDGTHIKIKNPGGEFGARHRCRKQFYSINVQIVCDARFKIVDIVARWRGSAHDSRIWRESLIASRLQSADLRGGVLLGDGGYACSSILLTPFRLSAQLSPAEQRYNRAHIRTRNHVEQLFGQMKNKFRTCFNGIQVNYETAKATIVAIAILHNISKDRLNGFLGDSSAAQLDRDTEDDYPDDDDEDINIPNTSNRRISGSSYRSRFIEKYFHTPQ